jgi:hypothetical protein
MTRRLDDLARNLEKLFDKPAAWLELVRHTKQSAREGVGAGHNEFPPLARR